MNIFKVEILKWTRVEIIETKMNIKNSIETKIKKKKKHTYTKYNNQNVVKHFFLLATFYLFKK